MDYLKELLKCAGDIHPVETPSLLDWQRFESEMDVVLPVDIKQLVSAFGSGCFGMEIRFWNPCNQGAMRYEKEQVELYMSGAAISMDFIKKGFWRRMFPENRNGYLIVAQNGLCVDVLIDLGNNGKVVVISINSDLVITLDIGIQRFLYELYTKKLDDTELLKYLRQCTWPSKKTQFFTPQRTGDVAGS